MSASLLLSFHIYNVGSHARAQEATSHSWKFAVAAAPLPLENWSSLVRVGAAPLLRDPSPEGLDKAEAEGSTLTAELLPLINAVLAPFDSKGIPFERPPIGETTKVQITIVWARPFDTSRVTIHSNALQNALSSFGWRIHQLQSNEICYSFGTTMKGVNVIAVYVDLNEKRNTAQSCIINTLLAAAGITTPGHFVLWDRVISNKGNTRAINNDALVLLQRDLRRLKASESFDIFNELKQLIGK
ncbi:MAG: hypothetical protein IPK81_12225 [Rhodospirillales bacterium]|nr:MAG: hypothetical protein IPK81_12225 [Rhodospirillales bacterium]